MGQSGGFRDREGLGGRPGELRRHRMGWIDPERAERDPEFADDVLPWAECGGTVGVMVPIAAASRDPSVRLSRGGCRSASAGCWCWSSSSAAGWGGLSVGAARIQRDVSSGQGAHAGRVYGLLSRQTGHRVPDRSDLSGESPLLHKIRSGPVPCRRRLCPPIRADPVRPDPTSRRTAFVRGDRRSRACRPSIRYALQRDPNASSPSHPLTSANEWEGALLCEPVFNALRASYAVALSSGLRQMDAGGKRIRAASIAVLADAMKPSSSMAWSMLECPISSRTRPAGLNVR